MTGVVFWLCGHCEEFSAKVGLRGTSTQQSCWIDWSEFMEIASSIECQQVMQTILLAMTGFNYIE